MRHTWTTALASSLIMLSTGIRPAVAAWPRDAFIGNVAICTATNYQYDPAIVSDGAGGAIIAWYDFRNGSHFDVYVQRISAAGTVLWSANGVAVCTAASAQFTPKLASDGSGGAIIAWYDQRSASSFDIYAQRINSAGVVQWTANGVPVCTATGDQTNPRILSDGAGGAIVSWEDQRGGAGLDIYAQRLSGSGVTSWTANGVAICTASGQQYAIGCIPDGAGGAILTWNDERSAASDIYAQRILSGGTVSWAANGVSVCTATGIQYHAAIAPDASGGAIITWTDQRSGSNTDIRAQRISAAGTGLWLSNGIAVTDATTDETEPQIASDGSGGAIITWLDSRNGSYDIFSQRVSAAGVTQWNANGIAQCTATGIQSGSEIISDESGGAIVLWHDPRSDGSDIYAQRVSGSGVGQWPVNGAAISAANSSQLHPTAVSDGAGGAIITWYDQRSGTYDIYAQRIERYGQLGNPEPTITSVSDVKNDQGGSIKLTWSASYLDADPTFGIAEYRVFRSVPGPVVSALALSRGATTESDEAVTLGKLLARPAAVGVTSWEYVGTHAAETFPLYSRVVPTAGDSVGGSNPRTAFMVEARASTSISSDRWFSAPDSGYSVDNIPPATPAPLTGQYLAGTTTLHWNRNTETDLAGYRLYRGSSVAFVPGPSSLVSTLPDTGAVDAAGAPHVYKLTAVDSHGNESPVATLVPTGTTGVGDPSSASELLFAPASPNPASRETLLRFTLPARADVSLRMYDAAGRLVCAIAGGALPAGDHAARWDLNDDHGRAVGAGLYFARLQVGGRTLVRRVAVTR